MYIKRILLLPIFFFVRYPAQSQVNPPEFHYTGTDSATAHISDRYKAGSFLRILFMGKNYRAVWQQPVTLPVFRLSETNFRIAALGGGKQTKSLRLTDSSGKTWALRTLDKDVTPALPPRFRHTVAQTFLQDQISSGMPYGSLIIGALAKQANILAAQPSYYFVADDTALGSYRKFFANRICMLEERDPGVDSTVSTEVVLRQIQRTSRCVVDQRALLKARLLDMLVADFDRHQDNWRWAAIDSAGLTYYRAIPRDRDWAFYYGDGLVPKLARLFALRSLINFDAKPKYITSLNAKAQVFDNIFLNSLTAADWQSSVHELQQLLSDDVVENAVRNLPLPVFAICGPAFILKLRSRRDRLEKAALDYYHFLAKEVQVDGSGDAETFLFLPAADGFLLQVYRTNVSNSGQQQMIYERRFLRTETYRLTINGLGGNDRFEVDEKVNTRIKLKLNGGTGNDSYELHGNIRVEVHDGATENNTVVNKNGAKIILR